MAGAGCVVSSTDGLCPLGTRGLDGPNPPVRAQTAPVSDSSLWLDLSQESGTQMSTAFTSSKWQGLRVGRDPPPVWPAEKSPVSMGTTGTQTQLEL